MNPTCPQCGEPCMAAELHEYHKCENCYVGKPETCHTTIPNSARTVKSPMQTMHPAGGGCRMVKSKHHY